MVSVLQCYFFKFLFIICTALAYYFRAETHIFLHHVSVVMLKGEEAEISKTSE